MTIQSSPRLSLLRKELLALCGQTPPELAVFLTSDPLIKGTVYTLRRKCGNPTCRCMRGHRHEALVLTARVGGKSRLWSLSEDRAEEMRRGTENYRRFRQARTRWIRAHRRRQKEMLALVDAMAKERIQFP